MKALFIAGLLITALSISAGAFWHGILTVSGNLQLDPANGDLLTNPANGNLIVRP